MSFPLTIPVSMPHHYVNSHYYGTNQPQAYQAPSAHVPTVVTSAFGSVAMMSLGNNGSMEAAIANRVTGQSLPAPPPSLVAFPKSSSPVPMLDESRVKASPKASQQQHKPRTVPIRKQSVFVAPSGISAIRAANSGRTTGPYALPAHSPSPPLSVTPPHNYLSHHTNHHHHHHHHQQHHHHRSVPLRTEWNTGQHPLDLSDSLPHHLVIRSGARESSQRPPSSEDISQHISKIIQNNKAIIEQYEPYSYHNSSRHSSKRSMSTTQLHSMESFVQSVITSGVTAGAIVPASPVPSYHTYNSSDRLSPNRRFSTDVVTNVNNYSKLQSALLGESKLLNEVPIADGGIYMSRKYSSNSTEKSEHHHNTTNFQPVPDQVRYPLQHEQLLSSFYYHQQQQQVAQQYSRETRKPSVIINPRDLQAAGMDGSLALLPLCESSRSSSEPSLVRNLLTSKTSAFTLVSNELASSFGPAGSTSTNVQSDSSIIKDLLLKSRVSASGKSNDTLEVMPQPPPRKRSRTESLSEMSANSLGTEGRGHDHAPINQHMFTCPQCLVAFRNQQNLEIHQRYYCRGDVQRQSMASGNEITLEPQCRKSLSGTPERPNRTSMPQRKVSVLERPSIITYTTNENSSSTMSDTSEESSRNEPNRPENKFGNILKSKLLLHESEISDSIVALKKRKISEPAFRYHYDSRSSRDSSHKMQRVSVLHMPGKVDRLPEHALEVLRDYSPYLMRPTTKITIKSPVEFPVLQDLVDTCMNHEFAVEEDVSLVIEKRSGFLSTTRESPLESDALRVDNSSKPSQTEFDIASEVRETLSNLLDEIERQAWSNEMTGQFDSKTFSSSELSSEVTHCLSDLIDTVANKMISVESGSIVTKKSTPTRPTTLDFASECSYEQSTRNQFEQLRKTSKLSIFVNRCSNQEECGKYNDLVASTLVSPDTPRPKRKYQQLFLTGSAYTNLGLKVTTRPTYCCIYRLQPMFVTQEAFPQLSMYSQWKTHPISPGDLLEHVRLLLASYNSQEAVYVASQSRLSLIEVATAATMGGLDREAQVDEDNSVPACRTSSTVIRDFLDRVGREHAGQSSTKHSSDAQRNTVQTTRNGDRSIKAALIPLGEGYTTRLIDSGTKSQLILTHSSYHRVGIQRSQLQRIRKRSRTHTTDFYKTKKISTGENPIEEMAIACSSTSSSIGTGQQTTQNLPPSTSKPLNDALSTGANRQRKRSSTVTPPSISNNFGPFMSMHPILGHLPNKSKQTVMYIMMMSQAPPALAVPSISQMTSSKNLASRKFSECIGLRQSGLDEQWDTKIGSDGTTEIVPKRIKIFEGGFKSNEDYTYIRGRGRGKYVCEDCGIRCKKPSMLKKHIRTHTDLRPYSCRHCAFAFKTKGNLTKHMKSKAHHKKCVELGIFPVPTTIDDSQIDNEALAKQEQYELSCGSSGVFSQFADDDDDDGDDYDDCDYDEEDDDDEGVPIPVIEQQRLTYIEPGQFDDADDNDKNSDGLSINKKLSTSKAQRKISGSSGEHHASGGTNNSPLTSTSISDRVDISSSARLLSLDDTLNPVLSISEAKRQTEDRDKNRLISSLANSQLVLSSPAAAAMIISSSQINNSDDSGGGGSGNPSTVAHSATKKCSIDQSYHHNHSTIRPGLSFASFEPARKSSSAQSTIASETNQNITQENEAEAARSLLILSGLATNAADLSQSSVSVSVGATKSTDSAQHVSPPGLQRKSSVPPKKNSALLIDSANSMFSSHHRLGSGSERTHATPTMSSPTNQMFGTKEQSTLDKIRRSSHPTSVIISHSHSASSESRKLSKPNERLLSNSLVMEPVPPFAYAHETPGLKSGSVFNHAKITSGHNITTPSQSMVAPTPTLASYNFAPHIFPHYSRLDPVVLAKSQQQIMEEFQKRGIQCSNDQLSVSMLQSLIATASQQKGLTYGTQIPMTVAGSTLNMSDLLAYQQAQSVQASASSTIPTLDSATLAQQQKLLQKFYENFQSPPTVDVSKSQPLTNSSHSNQYLIELNRLNEPQKNNLNLLSNHVQLATSMYTANHSNVVRTSSDKELLPKPTVVTKLNESVSYDSERCKTRHSSSVTSEASLQSSGRANSSPVPLQYRTNSPSASTQHRISPTAATLRSSPMTTSTSPLTVSHTQSADLDQPMDLSKSSAITKESEPALLAQTTKQASPIKSVNPEPRSSQSVVSVQHTSPSKKSINFSQLIEKHHLTDQITRSFSPLNELQTLPVQKTFDQSHPNGHELYKRLRSDEFVHLAPGVHTPHRLPKNIQHLLNSHSGASSASDNVKSEASVVQVASGSSSLSISSSSASSVPFTTGDGKSTCPTCMKQFSKPAQLRLHYNIHLFERPFRCDACAVSFRTKGHLQKHSRSVSHLNKLNMSLTFGRPSNDNPRPFKCSDCKIAFRIHGHLAKHLRSKMHIMKLECLGKLPFGMFAEMERSNIELTTIDTTDCEKALESLRSLAQRLYDPRQMCWKMVETPDEMDDDVIEEDGEEIDGELDEELAIDEEHSESSEPQPSTSQAVVNGEQTSLPQVVSMPIKVPTPPRMMFSPPMVRTPPTVCSPPMTTTNTPCSISSTSPSQNSTGGIASTRSNTCHLCGRLFKAAKFLQVHLYTEHPEATSSATDTMVSSD